MAAAGAGRAAGRAGPGAGWRRAAGSRRAGGAGAGGRCAAGRRCGVGRRRRVGGRGRRPVGRPGSSRRACGPGRRAARSPAPQLGQVRQMVAVTAPHLRTWSLPVPCGGEDGVGLELGQQGAAVAGADAGGLGQPGAGHGLAGGDQRGVGLAGALALARPLAGGQLLVEVGRWLGGGRGAVEQAEHGEATQQPHRSGPGGQVADQGGRGDGDLGAGWTGPPRRLAAATTAAARPGGPAAWPPAPRLPWARARASVPSGHSSGMARPPTRAAVTMAP
jgi:hypothetical protein